MVDFKPQITLEITFRNSPKHPLEGYDLGPVDDAGRDVELHAGNPIFAVDQMNVILLEYYFNVWEIQSSKWTVVS